MDIVASVAINDRNNLRGQTGSPLTFEILGDRLVLWKSAPMQSTGTVIDARVALNGVHNLTLQVSAAGSNACAHSVWVDPKLRIKLK